MFIETCGVLVEPQFQQITHRQCNNGELWAKIYFYSLIETHGSPCWGFFRILYLYCSHICQPENIYNIPSVYENTIAITINSITQNTTRIFIINNINIIIIIITIIWSIPPRPIFGLWVLSLPASVCAVCTCEPRACSCGNPSPVKPRITKFASEGKRLWLRSLLYCGAIDLDLHG